VPHLNNAVSGNNDLVFCAADFNPFPQLKSKTDPETESLIILGRQILALRGKVGESSQGSIAERICWYCISWGKQGDLQGKAAQALAGVFLREILEAGKKEQLH
jgi:hypothetical protein